MRNRSLALLALLFLLIAQAGSEEGPVVPEEEARNDLQKLQGTWQLESLQDSKKAKVEVKKRTLFVGGDLFLVREGDRVLQVGQARLVTGRSPRRIDVVVRKGLHADNTMLGIYALKGDTLEICFDPDGEGRPASFDTKTDTSRYVAVYKRVRAAEETIEIRGKYRCESFGAEGKKQTLTAEIQKHGDAYLVRWSLPGGTAFIGTGIRKGNTLSVCWANRGSVGLSVYRIEKGPKLSGQYTELGGPGIIAREDLVLEHPDRVEVRKR